MHFDFSQYPTELALAIHRHRNLIRRTIYRTQVDYRVVS
jgi:hypothetical protein